MADEVIAELANRGHADVRPLHEFALRAVDAGADTASELGRRLSVSKQAAAKTIAALEQLGYVDRETDPHDARRKPVRVTPRGAAGERRRSDPLPHRPRREQPNGHKDPAPAVTTADRTALCDAACCPEWFQQSVLYIPADVYSLGGWMRHIRWCRPVTSSVSSSTGSVTAMRRS
ncbi:MarR family winged helix-turn-helix transcriptional regulator [Streptomyces shenzhenensis]|uniref:MarR family winged helix-turn-helix transcriptional regulator n=1 Tax=Streptomyces shenzhenensis TaxID=943815 RepID=UPI00381B4B86